MAKITYKGVPMQTLGSLPPIGSQAPDFTVTKTDLGEISLHDHENKKIILNIFPSLDTPVCSETVRRFNEIGKEYPNVLILCISADLPFAQERFCIIEHVDNVLPASTFRHPDLGKKYGVLINEGPLTGLLARAVIVINEQGKVAYTELVPEIFDEPHYKEILTHL